MATATLADAPWVGTSALYWAEAELVAPCTPGFHTWEAKLAGPDLEPEHKEASCTFAFATVKPPEHVVTVKAIDRNTKAPNQNAHVTLHTPGGYPYRACTDESGVARVSVPKGEYGLYVLMNDYRDFETVVEVTEDVAISAEMTYWPQHYQ